MASSEPATGEDIDALTVFGEHLVNAILEYESLDNIKRIIENGAPVWYQNEAEGISALHAAAFVQNLELVQFLIEKGAVWNAGRSVLDSFLRGKLA
jgi:protein arginine N-methyltransferase 2